MGRTFPCPECIAERKAAEVAERQERARAGRERDLRANLMNMGVNVRKYFDKSPATLDTFNPNPDRAALEAAKEFLGQYRADERPGLYLFSERPNEALAPGNGKTHLAVAILRDLALDPAVDLDDLCFVFVPRLLLEIQNTFDSPTLSTLDVVKRYTTPELLVWDDFGAEKLSDFAVRTLYTILYEREGRSNIFTSNLNLERVESRDTYAERITSRLAGDCRFVTLRGPDRRYAKVA